MERFLLKHGLRFAKSAVLTLVVALAVVTLAATPRPSARHSAAPRRPVATNSTWVTWAVLGAFVVLGLVIYSRGRRGSSTAAVQPPVNEDELAAKAALRSAFPAMTVQGFMEEPGETVHYSCQAELIGLHTVSERVGGGGGMSVRVARGVYLHSGGFGSHSVKHNVTSVDDTGSLVVTDRRLVFLGKLKTRVVALTKVVHVEPFVDGLRVDVENKPTLTFHTGTRVTFVVVERARRGILDKDLTGAEYDSQFERLSEPAG